MPRHPRQLSSRQVYHVMIRGNERKNIFHDEEDKDKLIDVLMTKKAENKFELYAYCLMDNHVHLLINERENPISRIMKCINVSYAMYFNKKYERVGHVFQDRFKSETVDTDEQLLMTIRYIHNNPLKANMVDSLEMYKWSSYREYISDVSTGKLTDTMNILNMLSNSYEKSRKQFIEFSKLNDTAEYIDIDEEAEIMTRQDALEFVENFLSDKNITLDELINQRDNTRGTIKHELVKELKNRSKLSCREIGRLLGLSKSAVHSLN